MITDRTDEAIELLSELRSNLDKASTDEHIVADVFNRLGTAYFLASSISDAYAHYVRAYQVSLSFPVFDELAAKISYNLGRVCNWIKDPIEASEHLEKAEKYFREIDDSLKLANTLFAKGLCYRDLNKLDLSELYLNESLVIYKSHNLFELAQQVKYNLACTVTAKKGLDLAIEQLLECAERFKELKIFPKVANTYVKIGEFFLAKGQIHEATQNLIEANQVMQESEPSDFYFNGVYAYYYKVYGKLSFSNQNYGDAIAMSINASNLYDKMGVKREAADSLEIAVDSYLKMGNPDEAVVLARRIGDLLRQSLDTFTNPEV